MDPPAASRSTVHFGVFEVDLRAGDLRKNGLRIRLQGQPFQVLAMLLERPGEIVTREEIQKRLWPANTFIDFEHSLNTAIKKLREALGDDADNPRFIETLPRHGYRFIYPVAPAPVAAVSTLAAVVAADVRASGVAPVYDRQTEVAAHRAALQKRIALAVGIFVVALAILLALNVAGLRDRIVGAGLVPARGRLQGAPLPKIESIAVLPLENLSRDPEEEYFADGMTEALITNLGKIRALRVISRTTAMHFKGTKKTLPEIARELNVDALVKGTVQRAGDRVRITANLLYAPTDRHLWAETYERDLRDVLALQSEVAHTIAEEIRIKVTPQEHARLTTTRPVNPEAYEAYLKGTYAFDRAAGSSTIIQYFRQAIATDPSYAQAYVGLGLTYIQMGFGAGPLPPREAFAETRQAALDALKLDATLAEAHSCLAWVKAFGEWDWAGGERDFRRAIELSPSSVEAHRMYSWYLSAMERHEEAITESQRARELDPVSPQSSYAAASAYWWARQFKRFAAESERLAEMDPSFPQAIRLRGLLYLQTGSYDQAIRHFQRAIALREGDPPAWYVSLLGCAYGRSGKRAEALKILNELQSRSKHKYVSPYMISYVHANLGDKHQAFQWLEKAYAERNTMLAFLRVDPVIDPLRSHPRFQDLLRRMNFPQ